MSCKQHICLFILDGLMRNNKSNRNLGGIRTLGNRDENKSIKGRSKKKSTSWILSNVSTQISLIRTDTFCLRGIEV